MTIPSISRLLDYARVQMAAEALYRFDSREQEESGEGLLKLGDTSFDSGLITEKILTDGNGHPSKFTATDAKAFAQEWEVVEHISNTGSGFSGTLLRRKMVDPWTGSGTVGEYVLSLRSTEFIDDAARDCEATNKLEIKEKGWAFGQIDDLENWYKSLKASGKLPLDAKLDVTGYRALGFSLYDHGARKNLSTVGDITNPKVDQVATAQLAVNRQIEQGEVANSMSILKMDANRPDVFGLQRRLLTNELALVPRLAFRMVFHSRLLGC